ncbi:DUF4268 domain-containing protein [Ornithinimicrobium cryptoxanthini]|uniref:DUF4268 domain-containing protein n=1 Tax=Ornithinimicrobium cryptoxanthini TaxID=2934161 RepID=A0ABY4YGG3_9MICO|nr:DUF4268 domain-containing protein [Ornithinimicrobium cryptoxanthini]USQ75350.1 DUF4268 domain-containing protein [Ornithinimicrobium cryptoxanthini]
MTDIDSSGLGRLVRVADPRTVWLSESGDFTPWLAENIDILGDELGMTLTVEATEVPVGQFRLDIKATDEDGRVVVIENQLERTDHSHLGQCLVYAAGLEAATVIWISRQFRDETRRAFDWLNERTDGGVQFFGIELSVVQIGQSGPRAPVFDVVSRPNDWQKRVKGESRSSHVQGGSSLNSARQDLFADILERVNEQRPTIRVPARNEGSNWINVASGPFGSWVISQPGDGRLRVEAYLDCGDRERNKALFDEFEGDEDRWEGATGLPLSFERLDDRRASRIATYHSAVDLQGDVTPAVGDSLVAWGATAFIALFDVLNEPLRRRARQLRTAQTQVDRAQYPESPHDAAPRSSAGDL